MEVIEELWRAIRHSGRYANYRAVIRLVMYWRLRTDLARVDVCGIILEDVKKGLPIGLRKHGFI